MTPLYFIIGCLATYRLTVLFARDAGPFRVFSRLRSRSQLVACPYCVSIWLGAFIEAAFYFSGVTDQPMVCACVALSFSGVTIALDRIFSSDHLQ